jgi:hypothetical protein
MDALYGPHYPVVMHRKSGDYKKVYRGSLLYCKTVKKLNDVVLENNFPPMIATAIMRMQTLPLMKP